MRLNVVFLLMVSCYLKRTLFKGIILNVDGELKNDEKNGVVKNIMHGSPISLRQH